MPRLTADEKRRRKRKQYLRRKTMKMLRKCFRHQHPEQFGRSAVEEPDIPAEIRYGTDHVRAKGRIIPEEKMGYPGVYDED